MLRLKQLAWFPILLALFCALLIVIPWPGLQRGYAHVFRAFGNVVFARFWIWPDGSVRFLDLRSENLLSDLNAATPLNLPAGFRPLPATKVLDTLMVLKNRRTPGRFGLVRTSARSLGYWTTALFLALALAWPMSWKRRGWALLWGLFLIHLFIAFRLTITLVETGFGADKPYALFDLSPFWLGVLSRTKEVAVHNPTVSFLVAGFVWLVVALPDVIRVLFPETGPDAQGTGRQS